MNAGADEGANAQHELNRIRAHLAHAQAATERLQAHGGLSDLSASVARMLAADLALAVKRERWITAALDRRRAA